MRLTGLPLLVALAVALVAAAVVAGRRHRLASAAALVGALLLAGTATAAGVNRHFGYYRSWRDLVGVHSPDLVSLPARADAPAVRREVAALHPRAGRGVLTHVRIPGPASGLTREGFVYLPPQYFQRAWADVRFPVVEMLHGAPGIPADVVIGLHPAEHLDAMLAAGQVGPLVVVMPDASGGRLRSGECVDAVRGEKDDTYLTTDVPAWATQALRVAAPGRGWGVGGFSTGGFCAANLALRHPDVYSAAVVLDGYFTAIEDHYARGIYHGDRAARDANSPLWELAHRPRPAVAFDVVAGKADATAVRDSTAFAAALTAHPDQRGPDVTLTVDPAGQHVFPDWERESLPTWGWLWHHLAPAAGLPPAGTALTGEGRADRRRG